MFVFMISRISLYLGHLWLSSRSEGQIKEIHCRHSKGHISCSAGLKIGYNVCFNEILDEFEFRSPRLLDQIKDIPCGHSRSHIYLPIDKNIGQNVCVDEIWDEFKFGSPLVIT